MMQEKILLIEKCLKNISDANSIYELMTEINDELPLKTSQTIIQELISQTKIIRQRYPNKYTNESYLIFLNNLKLIVQEQEHLMLYREN